MRQVLARKSVHPPQTRPVHNEGTEGWLGRGNRVDQDGRTREIELLERTAGRDIAAFRELTGLLLPTVTAVARRILGSDGEVDDIAQEAMIRLWDRSTSLVAQGNGAKAWLRRVVTNLCIDRLRLMNRYEDEEKAPEQTTSPTQLSGMIDREIADRVARALDDLPARQRLALTLFHYEGLSQTEIGDIVGVSEEAVESLLARARRRMRTTLASEWRQLLKDQE